MSRTGIINEQGGKTSKSKNVQRSETLRRCLVLQTPRNDTVWSGGRERRKMCQTVMIESFLSFIPIGWFSQQTSFSYKESSRVSAAARGKRHILPSLGSLSKIKQVVNCDERWCVSAARDSWDKTRWNILHSRLTPGQFRENRPNDFFYHFCLLIGPNK